MRCPIDAYNANANRVPTVRAKLLSLPGQIVCHTINLFDHCFHQNFNLDTYLDCRNMATANNESIILHGISIRYDLAEAAVAAPSANPTTEILCV